MEHKLQKLLDSKQIINIINLNLIGTGSIAYCYIYVLKNINNNKAIFARFRKSVRVNNSLKVF